MRWLKFLAPAVVLAASVAVSFAQRSPPAEAPPAEAPDAAPPPATSPGDEEPGTPPTAAGEDAADEFIPTEELQPDAAVTFPVDI